MATLSPDVTAAVATLQARWGAAAPRVAGALARRRSRTGPRPAPTTRPELAPHPDPSARAATRRRRPDHPHRLRGARRDPRAGRPAAHRPASRSAATARAAGRPSPSGSPPRPRRTARSWPGWTSPAQLRPGRGRRPRRPARMARRHHPGDARRGPGRSPARCWPVARSTCSSSTCPAAGWPPRTSRPGSPTGSAGWRRSPGASETLLVVLEPPGLTRRPGDRRRRDRPASASSSPGGRGSGSGATSSASGRRRWSPATATARRGGGRRSGSSTRRAASATPASAATTSSATTSTPPIACPRRSTRTDHHAMRLLHLHRPHLPLELARARASEPFPPGPLVLGGRPWIGGPVIDANPEARALGVRRGMPLGSAHRLAPEATFIDPDPDADRATVEAAFETLAAFSPGIAGTPTRLDAAFGLFEVQVDGLERAVGAGAGPRRAAGRGAGRAVGRTGDDPRPADRRHPVRGHGRRGPRPPRGAASSCRPAARPTSSPRTRPACSPRTRTSAPGSTRFGLRRIGAVAELARIGARRPVRRGGRADPRPGPRRGARAVPAAPDPGAPRARPPDRARRSRTSSRSASSSTGSAGALTGQLAARGLAAARARPASRPGPRVRPGGHAGGAGSSSSASPSRPPTPRRSSASCSPGWSGLRRRRRSPGSRWSWTARARRPVSSSRCSRHRPPVAPGSSWQLARLALTFGEDRVRRVAITDPEAPLPERAGRGDRSSRTTGECRGDPAPARAPADRGRARRRRAARSRSAGTAGARPSRSAIAGGSRRPGGASRSPATTSRSSGDRWLALVYLDRVDGSWHLERALRLARQRIWMPPPRSGSVDPGRSQRAGDPASR